MESAEEVNKIVDELKEKNEELKKEESTLG